MASFSGQALVKVAPRPGALALRDIEPSDPGPAEVRIRLLAAGVCGTDLAIYDWPEWIRDRVRLPVTIGHEGCGVVEALGPGVTEVAVGDLVAVESHIFCGTCAACRSGRAHICERLAYVGMARDGLFAERAVLPARLLYRLPPDLPAHLGALMEPFGLSVRAVLHGAGVRDLTVLITGCGPLGLAACVVAAHEGARRIIASEVASSRLEACRRYARRLGVLRIVDPGEEDLNAAVADLTEGRGADVWIDFSGGAAALRQGFAATRAGGEARLLGVGDALPLAPAQLVLREIRCVGFHGRLIFATWPETLRLLIALRGELEGLISHRLPLRRYADAFDLLQSGRAMKLLFEFD